MQSTAATQIARARRRGQELAADLPPAPRASRGWRVAHHLAYFVLTAGFIAVGAGVGMLVVAPFS